MKLTTAEKIYEFLFSTNEPVKKWTTCEYSNFAIIGAVMAVLLVSVAFVLSNTEMWYETRMWQLTLLILGCLFAAPFMYETRDLDY